MKGCDDQRAGQAVIIECVRDQLDLARRRSPDRDLPYVTLTYAQSIDGSIARVDAVRLRLSNLHSEKLTHQLRAQHDAILVGINTVLSDDPRLDVRFASGKAPQPVIMDSRLRLPLESKLLKPPGVSPIVVAGDSACQGREDRLVETGAQVIRLALQDNGWINLTHVLMQLKQSGLNSVMIEGGASIITSVLTAHLANQFVLTISPRFVGGLSAVSCRDGSGSVEMLRLHHLHYQWLAGDLILQGLLDPAREAGTASDFDKPLM